MAVLPNRSQSPLLLPAHDEQVTNQRRHSAAGISAQRSSGAGEIVVALFPRVEIVRLAVTFEQADLDAEKSEKEPSPLHP
jgi:hypothetical protein